MDRIKKMSLYQKLIIIIFIFALVPLLLLGQFGYQKLSNYLLNQYAESNWQTVYQIKSQINRQIDDIQGLMTTMAMNSEIQTMLKKTTSSSGEYKNARLLYDFTLVQLSGQPMIEDISLLSNKGNFYDSHGRFASYNDVPEKYEGILDHLTNHFSMIQTEFNTSTSGYVTVLAQRISDVQTGEMLGVVVVKLDSKVLNQIFVSTKLGEDGFVFLLDEKERILSHPTMETKKTFVAPQVSRSETEHYFINTQKDDNYLYVHAPFENPNWTLYGAIPYSELSQSMSWFRNGFYIFMVIMIVFLMFLGYFLQRQFVKPIRKIQRVMGRVEDGDLTARIHFKQKDEIGNLGNSFNGMVERLEYLFKKVYEVQLKESKALLYQKNAEFESLQKQITPHFLYNTLNSVSWLAGRKGVREIEFVIDALSDMLRYSIEPSAAFSTLKREIENIEDYIAIIDFRYESTIGVNIHIDEALENIELPRLTMQPIIENAIIHGFQTITGEESIDIIAKLFHDKVRITVKDNGLGMPPKQLKLFQSKLNVSHDPLNATVSSSIGIINVHRRIQLRYGVEYGLVIESELNKGTIVEINLPFKT